MTRSVGRWPGEPACDRCTRRAGAVNALGVERLRIAASIGQYRVERRGSGLVTFEHLCAEDLRGLRAMPGLFRVGANIED